MAISFPDDPFAESSEGSMAESVTRHALISTPGDFHFLLCGIDSLDLGFFVNWMDGWEAFQTFLQAGKDKALQSSSYLDQTPTGRKFLHLPSGKAPNYRFHLQFPEYHAYIAITNPPRKSPNVYLSFNASTLWGLGLNQAVDLAILDLRGFGGSVFRIVPSRLDLCADYLLPGGLSLAYLQRHAIARSRSESSHVLAGVLETYYSGSPGAPMRLRIYDKAKEIRKSNKLWFEDLWGLVDAVDVWRVEYQLRRPVLKQFSINNIDDLAPALGGLWAYLTAQWFSLRDTDDDQQNRRTVLPWWIDVQSRQAELGPAANLTRTLKSDSPASSHWYVSHISGCLASYAARIGVNNFNDALNRLNNGMCEYWFERKFTEELNKRQIRLAQTPTEEDVP